MDKDVPVNVITPDEYRKGKEFPVVYILHGCGDNHTSWTKGGVTGLLSDQYGIWNQEEPEKWLSIIQIPILLRETLKVMVKNMCNLLKINATIMRYKIVQN